MSHSPLPDDRHYTADDVKIIEKSVGYDGFFKVNRYRLQHKLFAGGWNGPIVRELFERGHAAALLPYDPVRDQIVLVEQFRIGAIETSATPWLLELVAGIIDAGETAETVVRREAVEEAGIVVGRCEHAISYLVSPGGSTERIEVYVGEVDASLAHGLHGLAEEGEDIRVHVVSREQAFTWLKEGRIDNAASVIALQWLALNQGELRARWLANR
ncbi:ADP-ribose diphosphatase [Aeromonas cavernicola]|uniref:ADP-ribose pyrophosphatase n=1 Tax=Aeromonas cavernicola TaxID=1006623 RepID=A0A2H9U7K0_9GAMM|nr:ADP-ribose diphosphatase [Aeromonas cavernicola]PJG60023.1 ADP-ribose diphosphatase [Aeromonas cavernicola]